MALTAAKAAELESMGLRRILSTTYLTPFAGEELDELTGMALQMIGQSPRLEELVRSLIDLDLGLPAHDLICSRSGRRRRVCHVGRVSYVWTTVRALDLKWVRSQHGRRLRRHFGASAPAVLAAIASAHENFASQLRHPSGGFYEPQLVESLRLLEAVLGVADHQALLDALLRILRRHRLCLGAQCQPPARRPVDLDDHDPPGHVILASPHVTNGPPRLRVAALMRWTEATPI